jgi:hypothetical protein
MKINNREGWTELIIDDNCEYDKFYAVADLLQANFNVSFTQKLNDLESSYWDFQFNGCELTLHYHVQTWLSIFPVAFKETSDADNKSVTELGSLLSQYFIDHNLK